MVRCVCWLIYVNHYMDPTYEFFIFYCHYNYPAIKSNVSQSSVQIGRNHNNMICLQSNLSLRMTKRSIITMIKLVIVSWIDIPDNSEQK